MQLVLLAVVSVLVESVSGRWGLELELPNQSSAICAGEGRLHKADQDEDSRSVRLVGNRDPRQPRGTVTSGNSQGWGGRWWKWMELPYTLPSNGNMHSASCRQDRVQDPHLGVYFLFSPWPTYLWMILKECDQSSVNESRVIHIESALVEVAQRSIINKLMGNMVKLHLRFLP